jgi:hypothetical protein
VRTSRSTQRPISQTPSASNENYYWKRLSLSKNFLYDMFPSIQSSSLLESWSDLSKQFLPLSSTSSSSSTAVVSLLKTIEISILPNLISVNSFLTMFLFSDYKNGIQPQSASNLFPTEIIFQDFCTISSM